MSEPTENEELNEALSTEELKSVSGGISQAKLPIGSGNVIRDNDTMLKGNGPEGSGSGMTLRDWNNSRQGIGPNPWNPIGIGETNQDLIN